MKPRKGDTVLVRHRVCSNDGKELESSFENSAPLRFTVGSGRVIPGMNDAVLELEIGEHLHVPLQASQAHGNYDESKFRMVRKTAFYQGVKVGQTITFQGELGEPIQARVLREEGEQVILDTNHPLAGHDLVLELCLVDILDKPEAEPFI